MPCRNLQARVSPRDFMYELLKFDGVLKSVMLWIDFSENRYFSQEFSQFLVRYD